MDMSALIIFAGALFIAAGSPGPSVAALVARVLTNGSRDMLPFLAAMWLGEAIWLSLAVWGLAAIAQTLNLAFIVIKYLGIAYLLYLAWRMWTAPVDGEAGAMPSARSPGKLFLAGMAITLGNPKIMVFYLALLPSIIDLSAVTFSGWAELIVTMAAVLMIIDFSWLALAARARKFLHSPRAVRIANRASAGLMAGAAAAIASR